MGINLSKSLDTSKSLLIQIKPTYMSLDKKNDKIEISDRDKLKFFKTKLDLNYLFNIEDYNFKVKDVIINNYIYVEYEIKYKLKKNKSEKSLNYFKKYISDAFHKETHAGDEKKINKNTYVLIDAKNVEIYQ